MKIPFQIDLGGKTAVITGAGGVLCSGFAKVLAQCGARVALLDINLEAAEKVASEIREEGGEAIAVCANCLKADSLEEARKTVSEKYGPCDILINGAGGNNPKGTTDNEQMTPELLGQKELKTFFDLDPDGIRFVFDLMIRSQTVPEIGVGQIFPERTGFFQHSTIFKKTVNIWIP